MPDTRSECISAFNSSRAPPSAYAARICSWLPARPSGASGGGGADEPVVATDAYRGGFGSSSTAATRLTESFAVFWRWLERETPTRPLNRTAGRRAAV
eukprot:scaffold3821_cov134-Isochrysis_galbana.AAC.15